MRCFRNVKIIRRLTVVLVNSLFTQNKRSKKTRPNNMYLSECFLSVPDSAVWVVCLFFFHFLVLGDLWRRANATFGVVPHGQRQSVGFRVLRFGYNASHQRTVFVEPVSGLDYRSLVSGNVNNNNLLCCFIIMYAGQWFLLLLIQNRVDR